MHPDKEASRYGFVLSNQTNLNRPRIGESEANPESRVAGHLERMPKEASPVWFRAKESDKPEPATDRRIHGSGNLRRNLRAGWPGLVGKEPGSCCI